MSKDTSRPKKWSTQTVTLPGNEPVPRTPMMFRVVGLQMNGDFDLGVRAEPEEDWSIDEFPQPVHDILSDMATDTIDMDRVRAEATQETWPRLGMLTLSRESGDTVKVDIEWLPSYLPTPADETE